MPFDVGPLHGLNVAVIRGAYRRGMQNVPQDLPIARTGMEHILRRIQGEFREMPGLRLTCRQAQRLWIFLQRTDAVASGMLRNAERFS